MQETLAEHGLAVSSIGSPIGKIYIDEDFGPHLERMRHAADVAHQLSAPYIRHLLVLHPARATTPTDHRDEVLSRMRALADVAEDAGVVLLHENEKDIYGDIPQPLPRHRRVGRTRRTCGSPGTRPTSSRWACARSPRGTPMLRPHLEYMQIKDALRGRRRRS